MRCGAVRMHGRPVSAPEESPRPPKRCAIKPPSGGSGDFLRDSRHGIRLLAKTPMFTAAAIVSLALGIGANTAIFSLMDAVILRMMPVHEPERLVQFGRDLSYPLFRQFRQELRCFTDMFAHSSMGRRDVIFDEEPEAASVEFVSGNYYSVLGVSAFAGRTFDLDIDRNPTPVAVISHEYWKRRFALDPAVIGRSFRWNGRVFTIIGSYPTRIPRRRARKASRNYRTAFDGRRNPG